MRVRGYTLIEVGIALLILAIVATAAIPMMGPATESKLDTAAAEIAQALRFAREEAMRTGSYRGVDFSVDPGSGNRRIRVFRTNGAVPPNAVYDVYHPLDKKLYDLQLMSAAGTQGATISKATFVYFRPPFTFVTRDWVAFDASGKPEYYPDTVNYSLVPSAFDPVQLAVTLSGKTRTVYLDTETARVTVQ